MASASAPASGRAVQLPAPASSLAVPPPAATTAQVIDLSAGAAILEDPGMLLLLLLLRRIKFSYYHLCLSLLLLPFHCLIIFRSYFVCTYSCTGSDTDMYEVQQYCLYCCSLHEYVACFILWNWKDVNMKIKFYYSLIRPRVRLKRYASSLSPCLLYTSPSPRD